MKRTGPRKREKTRRKPQSKAAAWVPCLKRSTQKSVRRAQPPPPHRPTVTVPLAASKPTWSDRTTASCYWSKAYQFRPTTSTAASKATAPYSHKSLPIHCPLATINNSNKGRMSEWHHSSTRICPTFTRIRRAIAARPAPTWIHLSWRHRVALTWAVSIKTGVVLTDDKALKAAKAIQGHSWTLRIAWRRITCAHSYNCQRANMVM